MGHHLKQNHKTYYEYLEEVRKKDKDYIGYDRRYLTGKFNFWEDIKRGFGEKFGFKRRIINEKV